MTTATTQTVYKNSDIWIQSGENTWSGFYIKRAQVDSTYLGVDGVCVLDEEGATDSISTIKTGINILKAERSMVGARQNRCLCAVRVDDNVVENSSAAESLIRDKFI